MSDFSTKVRNYQGAPESAAPVDAGHEVVGRRLGAGSALPGLSTAHISPASVTVALGGLYVGTRKESVKLDPVGGGVRGRIAGFSRQSRRRLILLLAKLRADVLPVFVTLTYPAEWPSDPAVWKRHLDTFDKRMAVRWPSSAFIWKLEAQKRGAPHYHLLVYGVPCGDELREWVAVNWYQVVDSGDIKHFYAGTSATEIRSYKGVISYAAKYMGKISDLPEEWQNPGRVWGVRRKALLPHAEVVQVEVVDDNVHRLNRALRRSTGQKPGASAKSFQVLVGDPEQWLEYAERLFAEIDGDVDR